MKLIRGGSLYLPAYFEDSSNDPLTGESLSNIQFGARYLDNSGGATSLTADVELGAGWYAYYYTDVSGKSLVYWAEHQPGTYKGFPGGIVEIVNVLFAQSTYNHPDSTGQQPAINITATVPSVVRGMRFDMNVVTQDTVIRIKECINGTTTDFRTIDSITWTTSMDPGVPISQFYTQDYVRVTFESLTAEGAARNIPYVYIVETL